MTCFILRILIPMQLVKPIQRNDMTNWPHFNLYALPKGK